MNIQRAHDILLAQPEVRKIRQKRFIAREIAKSIVRARHERNLTQADLAQMIGTRQSSIARLENGETMPSLVFLHRIAEALGDTLLPPVLASQAELPIRMVGGLTKRIEYHLPEPAERTNSPKYSVRLGAHKW